MSQRRDGTDLKLAQARVGSPTYLGRIAATTVKDNSTTSSPFTIPNGAFLLLYPSAACNYGVGSAAGTAVTSTTGVPMASAEKCYLLLKHDENLVQIVGTANVDIWLLE